MSLSSSSSLISSRLRARPLARQRTVYGPCGSQLKASGSNGQRPVPVSETAIGDADRLHQVVVNLLSNARAHTPPGTTVTVSVHVPGWGKAELAVTDDGPGIPKELQKELFERFVRADKARSRASGGSGLGLAIVKAVVSSHGGTMDVESRPGRTVFRVTLPAR